MLKKINRIGKRKEFEEIKAGGKVIQSPFFGLAVMKKDDNEKKFAFIISKKISKRAVDRNRIKRILAEGIRKRLDKIGGGWRGVFLVKKSILGRKTGEINAEVDVIVDNFIIGSTHRSTRT